MNNPQPSHQHSGHNHFALINILLECATSCEMCAAACLDEEDVKMMTRCIELDRDCADICFLTAKLLIRDNKIAHKLLAVCEEICGECAKECSKHEHNHCKKCAEICQKCQQACKEHLEANR
ncbi:MAG: four-helix bundle copper-binding protein [Ferruginibacter sp.]